MHITNVYFSFKVQMCLIRCNVQINVAVAIKVLLEKETLTDISTMNAEAKRNFNVHTVRNGSHKKETLRNIMV